MTNNFVENIAISNKFDCSNFEDIYHEINEKIARFTNPFNLSYKFQLDKISELIIDEKVARYQQKILKTRFEQLGEEFNIDLDKLEIAIKATPSDIKKLLDKDRGITFVRKKSRKERVTAENVGGVGSKNKSKNLYTQYIDLDALEKKLEKEQDPENPQFREKPYFTHQFSLFIDNDTYRYINIYIADPTNENNIGKDYEYNIEINFIPTRFTPEQISMAFCHISSVLNHNRYRQLMRNAIVLQYDTGYMFYGVSQLFAFLTSTNQKFASGTAYPLGTREITESSYIGELDTNNTIGYDKVLKEFKFFLYNEGKYFSGYQFHDFKDSIDGFVEWYRSRVCTLRVESRQKSKKPLLVDIPDLEIGLSNLRILKPKYLRMLPKEMIKKLISNKDYKTRIKYIKELKSQLGIEKDSELDFKDKGKKFIRKMVEELARNDATKFFYKFDKEKLDKSRKKVLDEIVNAIIDPKEMLDCSKIPLNYSDLSNKNRNILEGLAKLRKETDCNVENLAFSKNNIQYVEGVAGSGKTRLIANIAGSLSKEQRDYLYILTFTNASKNDIAERIKAQDIDSSVNVSTINAWAGRIAKKFFGISDTVITDEAAETIIQGIIDGILEDIDIEDDFKKYFNGETILKVIGYCRAFSQYTFEQNIKKRYPDLSEHVDQVKLIYDEYNKYKYAHSREDFTGMLENARKALSKKRNLKLVAKHMKYLLVDEVQDLDSNQWQIISLLKSANVQIIVVGDPAQSIYQFRGAIPSNIKKMIAKPTFSRFNHRSTQGICDVSNLFRMKISKNFESAVSKSEIENNEKPRLIDIDDFKQAVTWILDDIESQEYEDGDVSIICRFNDQIEYITDEMKIRDIKIDVPITIHKSKGLEFKSVYFIDPRYRFMGFTNAKEELCNIYVAVSRAKEKLTIVRSKNKAGGKGQQGSKFNALDQLGDSNSVKSGRSLVTVIDQ